jgi:predicted MFS family arabinose efflux permease
MPRSVYLLALGVFAMVTSEFTVAGLMPQMADGLDATVPQIGYLITAFAVAMAVGGPFLTMAVLRLRPKRALLTLFAVFLAGNVLAAIAPTYAVMLVARVITGVASQAFFGVAISMVAQLTRPEVRGRAVAVAMNGLMLGTLLGLPLATLVGDHLGWRAAFWAITALALLAAACTAVGIPDLEPAGGEAGLRAELGVFRNGRLWLALSTSTLIIGATFAMFSYVNPLMTDVAGFAEGTVPLLLIAYGAATVVGKTVVGRLADRYAVLADVPVAAVAFLMGVGLVGVTMNPAMVTRVQRVGNARPVVNTVHSSFITAGVILGSSVGGLLVDGVGLRGPLWLGVGLAVAGILTVLPDLRSRPAAATPVPAPASVSVPDRAPASSDACLAGTA